MLRIAFKSLVVLAVVGGLLGALEANAGLRHRGGSSGGGWRSSGGSNGVTNIRPAARYRLAIR